MPINLYHRPTTTVIYTEIRPPNILLPFADVEVPNLLVMEISLITIVAHAMFCTLEKEDVGVLGCEELRFRSLLNVKQMGCFGQNK